MEISRGAGRLRRRHRRQLVNGRERLTIALLLAAGVAVAQAEDAQGTAPPAQGTPSKHWSGLPFLAGEALARGYELPLPFGAGLVLTGIDNRQIDVSDVRIGFEDDTQSVSDYATLGSSSTVFNANFRFDTWLLPFLNVYALVGYVHNDSDTHFRVTIPAPGPLPGQIVREATIDTSLDGYVGGAGITLAAGYKSLFMVADYNYSRADLGFDDNFTARIGSIRAGWQGKVGGRPLQTWLGAGNWDTAATAKGHLDLEDGRRLVFEADQHPHTEWMYEVGVNFFPSKRWQLFADFAADFNGGYALILGPTFRF
jgi:hypothetical protein